ncbi:MAG TPA: Gfo/Idh/MocA family oxidoreductase [Candidatus Binatia bacterium]|nr:Gfo/Idh/MocA family oxidoreductase [Candidatus Binatia bacterium]
MSTVQAGVIGAGHLGAFHAQKYASMEGVQLAAVFDVDPARAAAVAAMAGCAAAGSLEQLLAIVDCASIAVPTRAHHNVALAAIDAGVHVLVEKPLAASAASGRAIVEAGERAGLLVQVGHLERFNPAFADLPSIVTEPRFIECHRLSPFAGRGTDTDVVFDVMIHDLDLISFVVGREVESVQAIGVAVLSDHADIANARLRFQGGCIANVTASRVSLKRERRLRIFQEDAYVAVDFDARSLRVMRRRPGTRIDPAAPMNALTMEERAFDDADPLREQIAAFVAAVRGERAPAVSGREAMNALELADQVLAAIAAERERHRR